MSTIVTGEAKDVFVALPRLWRDGSSTFYLAGFQAVYTPVGVHNRLTTFF
jgi:hypothetical protein